jgi:death-on-curing protein
MTRVQSPRWLTVGLILALHERLIVDFGGRPGLRDKSMLESAIERPHNLALYGRVSLFDLAAAYAFGLVKNHPFIDGNKRVSWMAATIFMETNGYICRAGEVDAAVKVLGLAAGELTQKQFAFWLRKVCVRGDALDN